MLNRDVVRALVEIADLLEIKGEEAYKALAYRRAARSIAALEGDLADLAARGDLESIPGVGAKLAAKIVDILNTGTCRLLDELRGEIPGGVLDMLAVSGVGPRTAALLYKQLGIADLDGLEEAARQGRLRGVRGLGERRELLILQGVGVIRARGDRVLLGAALPLAEELRDRVRDLPGVLACDIAGSVRRRCELVGDIDLVAVTDDAAATRDAFMWLPVVAEIQETADDYCRAIVGGVRVEFYLASPGRLGDVMVQHTGCAAHLDLLREHAAGRGLRLYDGAASEAQFYARLGLDPVPPELREGGAEIEAAAAHHLPALIDIGDIRGDLHVHSDWSDGVASLAELAAAARRRGYAYIAICDHSPSLTVAHGLDQARLEEQRRAIAELNRQWDDFALLCGVEVDILKDGRLDLPCEFLGGCDVVVASVHSGFHMDEQAMTARVVRAVQSGCVDVLAHPTGRLIGMRAPYAVDLEAAFQACRAAGVALEINASSERLDLRDEDARRAGALGIPLAIDTDAHSLPALNDMRYGVGVARRAWLSRDAVVNAWPLEQVRRRFGRRRQ